MVQQASSRTWEMERVHFKIKEGLIWTQTYSWRVSVWLWDSGSVGCRCKSNHHQSIILTAIIHGLWRALARDLSAADGDISSHSEFFWVQFMTYHGPACYKWHWRFGVTKIIMCQCLVSPISGSRGVTLSHLAADNDRGSNMGRTIPAILVLFQMTRGEQWPVIHGIVADMTPGHLTCMSHLTISRANHFYFRSRFNWEIVKS